MGRTSGKALHWILGGCAAVFVLGVLGVGSCVMLVMKVTKAPVQASEKFLAAMGAADLAGARAACEPGVAAGLDLLYKADPGVWGKTWSVTGSSFNTNSGTTTSTVTVSMNGNDGKTHGVELVLLERTGWKVSSIRVDGREVASSAALEFKNIDVKKTKSDEGWEVVVTYEVHGLRSETRGANKRVAATEGVIVRAPDGKEIVNKPEFKTVDGEAADPVVTFTNKFTLPPEVKNGKYSVHCTVKDHLGGGSVEKDIDFTLP